MIRSCLLGLAVLLALPACSLSPPVDEKRIPVVRLTHRCVPDIGEKCSRHEPISCEEHFVDACYTGAFPTHQCVGRMGPECVPGAEWDCPEGFEDGCESGTTKRHQCVATNGGVLCGEILELDCPLGFRDRCKKE